MERKVIAKKASPFPVGLEDRLSSIFNVVNTEIKNVTFLHLTKQPMYRSDIKKNIRDTLGKEIHLPQSLTFEGYCNNSFLPTGLIFDETIITGIGEKVQHEYYLTEFGEKYGLPISAFTLDYVFNNAQSMFSVLGAINSITDTRAPLSKIKILEELRKSNSNESELAKLIGLYGSNILEHTRDLKNIGFVYFDSVGDTEGGGYAPYIWIGNKDPEEAQPAFGMRSLTKEVAKTMKRHKRLTYKEIANLIHYNDKGLSNVSKALCGLEKQGFVQREKWKGGEILTKIKLLKEGIRFLDDYIEKLKNSLLDGNSLKEMQETYEKLQTNPEMYRKYANKAIELYWKVSPVINARPFEETTLIIKSFLQKNPGSRCNEIAEILEVKEPTYHLRKLLKEKIIKKIKKGKSVRFYINEN